MAKKDNANIEADVAAIRERFSTRYGKKGRAAIIMLDDGERRSCTIFGDDGTIFELLARNADHIIRAIGKNPENQIGLAERFGALVPAMVRAKNGDTSVLDALAVTVCADADKDDD